MDTESTVASDVWLIAGTIFLVAFGALMVFSATAVVSQETFGSSTAMIGKHMMFLALGVFALIFFNRLDPDILRRYAIPGLFLGVVLLILVATPGIGHAAGGARRWFRLGPLRGQPGEFAKLLVVLYIASYIGRHHHRMHKFFAGALVPLAVVSVFAFLLLLQPDFGTSSIILIVVALQLVLVSRISHLAFVGLASLSAAASLILSSPYRLRRLQSFMNPFDDPSDAGYQLIQSLIAVGSGGMGGVGLGSSSQKLFYLPAAHTDFIFAVIAEEWGFLGAALVLGVFMLIAARGLAIAWRLSNDHFLSSLALGCTALLVVPALLNMGVVLGLLPTKGLVLPLVAYGGSAMIVNLSIMGILLRLSQIDDTAVVQTVVTKRRAHKIVSNTRVTHTARAYT